ncbi:hypothetical protein CH249_25820 [Rhodococcus sp. 05-2255-3B1]|uniref:hypothetical protein n=1 Tax=Rhodococcus sp. 05-2255-3B1 TaxID=2022482 RepID=UPI000B9C10E6|nr:hypothetical protein [Rhodococcus sp. 05-2255-3B1]OZE04354.1 hypothetical protein CH249_25820 [Rhodococcus sp. 05-2255-3B1]
MNTCKNCGRPISRVNYALGPEWMHGGGPHGDKYPVGGHDMFAAYRECRTTVAEPAEKDADHECY